jgi:hypothetical protein
VGSVNRARAPNKPEAELEIRTINPLDQTVTSGSATRMPVLLTIMLMAGGSLVIAILRRTPPSAGSPRSSSCSLASPKACRHRPSVEGLLLEGLVSATNRWSLLSFPRWHSA